MLKVLLGILIAVHHGFSFCHCEDRAQVPKLTGSSRHPESTSVYQETRTCLMCRFNSSSTVTVSWFKDGKNLSNDKRVLSRSIMKAQSMTLNRLCIDKLRPNDTGIYKCSGRNIHGQGDSMTFILKVIPFYKPVIDRNSPPDKVVLYRGESMTLDCIADGYPTVNKYTWSKKSGFIDRRGVQTVKNGLFFSYAVPEQSGEYICNAENNLGKDFKSVKVLVVSDPSWETMPTNKTLNAGNMFSLSGSFYGNTNGMKVTWYLNNIELPIETIPRKKKVGQPMTVTYTVPSAKIQHNGRYELEIRNRNGKIATVVNVYVYAKPDVIINEGREVMATVGEVIQITCEAQGNPPPVVTWNSDGRVLAKTALGTNFGTHIKSSLTHLIYPVKGAKTYTCTGKNIKGSDTEAIRVITKGDSLGEKKDKQEQVKSNADSKIPIIIAATSAAVIIIVILALIIVIKYRHKEKSNLDSTSSPEDGVRFSASAPYEEDHTDEDSMLIEEPMYITPLAASYAPKLKQSRKSSRKFSAKARHDNDTLEMTADTDKQYTVILPIGQGRLLSYEDLALGEICGSGQYGVVVKGTLNEEGSEPKEIAVKMLKSNAGLAERKVMLDELKILRSLSHHPNIVALIGWAITYDNVYIVEELVKNGSLLQCLRSERLSLQRSYVNLQHNSISENDALTFAWQVASGMQYLSSQDVVHRDLAARNILLAQENLCKIADFGLARQIYQNTKYTKTTPGELPVRWMAFESIFNGIYTSASDVWSFGVLLWEIVTLGDIPYSEVPTISVLIQNLSEKKRMKKPGHISDDLYQLMLRCWSEKPSLRPDFADLTHMIGKMLSGKKGHISYSRLENYFEKVQEDFEDMGGVDDIQNVTDHASAYISDDVPI